jgi:zinc transporter, ZIP family
MTAISAEAFGFLLVLGAGLSTCIGGAVVYFPSLFKLASEKALAASLGLSAGVMLYVSFVEILVKSNKAFVDSGVDEANAYTYATLCFFGGFVVMMILDKLVHMIAGDTDACVCIDNDQLKEIHALVDGVEMRREEPNSAGISVCDQSICENKETDSSNALEISSVSTDIENGKINKVFDKKKLKSMGLTTALAIGLHNFPEGLATFVAALDSPHVGVSLAIAIAIHNIPEGLCVSMPIYYATGDAHKAFLWSAISGLSEVVAAGLAWAILANLMVDSAYGILFGLVAGMMVNICVYQLIPTAHRYDKEDKVVSHSTLIGMGIMAISLIAFKY